MGSDCPRLRFDTVWSPHGARFTRKKRTLFTTHQVAELLEAHPSTVLTWANDGLLRCSRTPGGHRRIHVGELVRFVQAQGMAMPEELVSARTRIVWMDNDRRSLGGVRRAAKARPDRVEVRTFDNTTEGILALGRAAPDIAVLDAGLDGLDWMEACRRLKANRKTAAVRTVLVARSVHPGDREEALAIGATAFLEKPARLPAVLDAVASGGGLCSRGNGCSQIPLLVPR